MRILLVEDNPRLGELVMAGLDGADFAADHFTTIADAEAALATTAYDALVLDLGLPDGDGLTLIQTIRRAARTLPILVLTARDGLDDRVTGLDAGADDYLAKPFAIRELTARLRALLRRPGRMIGITLTVGDLTLDTVGRTATVAGAPVPMTRREIEALETLMRRAGSVVSKSALEQSLYGFDDDVGPNAVEALISRLRKRLAAAGAGAAIHTIRGLGYLLREQVAGCDQSDRFAPSSSSI
jgi:DNA-binding response OmpR family regulator